MSFGTHKVSWLTDELLTSASLRFDASSSGADRDAFKLFSDHEVLLAGLDRPLSLRAPISRVLVPACAAP